MKNKFTYSIISLFVLFFMSCKKEDVNYTQTKENIENDNNVEVIRRIDSSNCYNLKVYRDTIDNHVYYIVTYRYDGGVTMLHSEDCMCKKKLIK